MMDHCRTPACNSKLIGHHLSTPERPIDDLHIERVKEHDCDLVRSFWRPSDEELLKLVRGGFVMLEVLGATHPPVRLGTYE